MLNKIDHIGVAVHSVDAVIEHYRLLFNLEPLFDEIVEEQKVRAVGFKVGQSKMEFLEPTSPDSPIARYMEKRGEGMHHIAWQVSDIEEMLHRMQENDVKLIDQQPRIGAEGKRIAFVHPKSMQGMLVELSEE